LIKADKTMPRFLQKQNCSCIWKVLGFWMKESGFKSLFTCKTSEFEKSW
jgi:hypothetical protein